MVSATDKEINDFIDVVMPKDVANILDITDSQKTAMFAKLKALSRDGFLSYKEHFIN